ncbi:asparagine synthase (glutamine-hydrolyzing) [soil metagenome]
MCGFVSIYSAVPTVFSPSVIQAMTDKLLHRGPDDFGYAIVGPSGCASWREVQPSPAEAVGVALGHRRLSIIDLSEAGRQPLHTPDRRYWLVYNGELYNYVELRDELRGLGHTFESDTDSEVLLTAFRQWGLESLQRFNGMYAFLIWDNLAQRLIAARDRLGIKPLFYTRIGSTWLFASEIKAFHAFPGFRPEPDAAHVFSFLWNDDVPEGGATFYANVRSLPAAHYMTLEAGAERLHRYWSVPAEPAPTPESPAARAEELLRLITDAVRLQLRADVPVATMLSGGLDSTTIAAVSNRLLRAQVRDADSLGGQQRAISSFYPGSWNDESARVNELARQLGIQVIEVFPHEENVRDTFMDVVRAVDEPFGGTMPIVQDLMMRRARAAGVAVTLNGHGPDEMFAGYPHRHCSFVTAAYALRGQVGKARAELAAMRELHQIGMSDLAYTLFRIAFPAAAQLARRIQMSPRRRYFEQDLFKVYGTESGRFADGGTSGRTPLERRLRRELFAEIVPRYLTYEDRVSMASSIESRVPFLDHRIVEFAFSLPDSDRISNGVTKSILRRAVRDVLPASIHASNLKVYIDPPFGRWLRGDLRPLVRDMCAGEMEVARYLDIGALRNLVQRQLNAEKVDVWEQRLVWRALVTEAWLRSVRESAVTSGLAGPGTAERLALVP